MINCGCGFWARDWRGMATHRRACTEAPERPAGGDRKPYVKIGHLTCSIVCRVCGSRAIVTRRGRRPVACSPECNKIHVAKRKKAAR